MELYQSERYLHVACLFWIELNYWMIWKFVQNSDIETIIINVYGSIFDQCALCSCFILHWIKKKYVFSIKYIFATNLVFLIAIHVYFIVFVSPISELQLHFLKCYMLATAVSCLAKIVFILRIFGIQFFFYYN